jgi:hypothetical protein
MILTNQQQTQKDRREYADYWGVAVGDVYWCDICECWDHNDEDGWQQCLCA